MSKVMLENHPRKPLFAALMSALLPGFGQLYNGEINKAIWVYVSFAILAIPMGIVIALYLPSSLMMFALVMALVAVLGVWLFGIVDAWRGAAKQSEYHLKSWQSSGMYVLVLVLFGFLALPLLTNYVRFHQVESFRIPSGSMSPTIVRGDFLFADKRYSCAGCKQAVQRGDIVVFANPNNRTLYYIKRVIALPEDHVQIRGNEIFVNGQSLLTESDQSQLVITESLGDKRWKVQWDASKASQGLEMVVPAGEVFVLGDNRSASNDSRTFGTVPLQDLVGKARQVWLSLAEDGVRWGRLGKVLN
ncbi:MAG: Signal peptidase I (EC [uncultured Thiotrichaceae bacterium]|uniref:Signal peptidase I n=1 Tax=uncultured Thiotrichaceae bacterium TaxID=298394 RepID=A0A6S6U2S5_9GAMM|nr:MAG: Signal peptidase I (EC [uncultured Thiotrichaceae bacterium]